jgi:hypothetical protein
MNPVVFGTVVLFLCMFAFILYNELFALPEYASRTIETYQTNTNWLLYNQLHLIVNFTIMAVAVECLFKLKPLFDWYDRYVAHVKPAKVECVLFELPTVIGLSYAALRGKARLTSGLTGQKQVGDITRGDDNGKRKIGSRHG